MLADHAVEAEHPRLQRLLAAEGEELARQGGGALTGPLDLLDVGAPGVLAVDLLAEQLALEGDRRQQVVERMGDAAGQAPHGLHALRVAQPLLARPQGLLGLLAFRDVAQRPAQPRRPLLAFEVADRGRARPRKAPGPRGLMHTSTSPPALAGADPGEHGAEGVTVLPGQVEGERLASQAPLRDADQGGGRLVGLLEDPVTSVTR